MKLTGLATLLALGAGAVVATRRARRTSLKHRVVLITGGSRGLGLELARAFGERGARLALLARDADELERAAEELKGRGIEVVTLPCDVMDEEQARGAVEEVVRRLGALDVLVNNAGVIDVGPLEHMQLEDFRQAMDTHFFGPLVLTLAARDPLAARKRGRIVNITSIGGRVSVPHLLPYTASKFALVGLSEGLRVELANEGISVTTVVPGLMRTGSPRRAEVKGQAEKEHGWFKIASSLPFLSSDAGRAARRIVRACEEGAAELYITPQAKLAAVGQATFPGLTAHLLTLVDRYLMPAAAEEDGEAAQEGAESESGWAPSPLTVLSDLAAEENNEQPSPQP